MAHKIVFSIKPGGEMETTVEGIEGSACEGASAWLDDLGEVTSHQRTPDYYRREQRQAARETVSTGTGQTGGHGDQGGGHGSPW